MMRMAPWRYEGGREGGRVSRSREHRVGGSRTPSLMTNRSLTAIPLVRKGSIQGSKIAFVFKSGRDVES